MHKDVLVFHKDETVEPTYMLYKYIGHRQGIFTELNLLVSLYYNPCRNGAKTEVKLEIGRPVDSRCE